MESGKRVRIVDSVRLDAVWEQKGALMLLIFHWQFIMAQKSGLKLLLPISI